MDDIWQDCVDSEGSLKKVPKTAIIGLLPVYHLCGNWFQITLQKEFILIF